MQPYSRRRKPSRPPPTQAWILPALSNPDRAPLYWSYALLYCTPLLRNGFDIDGYVWAMLALGAVHIQVGGGGGGGMALRAACTGCAGWSWPAGPWRGCSLQSKRLPSHSHTHRPTPRHAGGAHRADGA